MVTLPFFPNIRRTYFPPSILSHSLPASFIIAGGFFTHCSFRLLPIIVRLGPEILRKPHFLPPASTVLFARSVSSSTLSRLTPSVPFPTMASASSDDDMPLARSNRHSKHSLHLLSPRLTLPVRHEGTRLALSTCHFGRQHLADTLNTSRQQDGVTRAVTDSYASLKRKDFRGRRSSPR